MMRVEGGKGGGTFNFIARCEGKLEIAEFGEFRIFWDKYILQLKMQITQK